MKRPGLEADHTSIKCRGQEWWSNTYTPPYVFTGNFTHNGMAFSLFVSLVRCIIWNICILCWCMQYVLNQAGQSVCQGNYMRLDNASDSAHEEDRSYFIMLPANLCALYEASTPLKCGNTKSAVSWNSGPMALREAYIC